MEHSDGTYHVTDPLPFILDPGVDCLLYFNLLAIVIGRILHTSENLVLVSLYQS